MLESSPTFLIIDLGSEHEIGGFRYSSAIQLVVRVPNKDAAAEHAQFAHPRH
jgi:hypothetical protein